MACNTASAVALEKLQKTFPIPIIGVIKPGAIAALKLSASRLIGVIGTYRTISSHSYQRELHKLSDSVKVIEKNCPLFVPIIEEGFKNKEIIISVIKHYLSPISHKIDTLVLGCTHYPLIKSTIKNTYPHLTLVDSALETSREVKATLQQEKQLIKNKQSGKITIATNDLNEVFERISHRLFPKKKVIYINLM